MLEHYHHQYVVVIDFGVMHLQCITPSSTSITSLHVNSACLHSVHALAQRVCSFAAVALHTYDACSIDDGMHAALGTWAGCACCLKLDMIKAGVRVGRGGMWATQQTALQPSWVHRICCSRSMLLLVQLLVHIFINTRGT